MSPPARAPATRAPAAPASPAVTPAVPAPARTPRRPAASGPPALRLAEPAPAPVLQPGPEPPAVAAQPQRPAERRQEEGRTERYFWDLVRDYAPDLEPIMREGFFGWLEAQITAAIKGFVDGLFAPVRAVTGVAATLTTIFQSLLEWMQEAAAKIAKGDCSSITEAVEKIEQVLSGIMSAVTDKLEALATKVADFFTGVWNRFGAPIWDMLKLIGGVAWNRVQQFATLIWDRTERLRNLALGLGAAAWKWIKTKLGIGDGPEGQNGLLQWVKATAEEVWAQLKPRIEPYKKQLLVIAGIMVALSPAGPLLAIGAGVAGVVTGIKWIREHLRNRDDVVAQRGVLQGTIIPALMRGMEALTGALKPMAARVTAKIGEVVGTLSQFAGSLASSFLAFATELIEWVGARFTELWKWANEKLTALVEWVTTGLARLKAFLQPVLDVLRQVAEIYLDILKIPLLVATKVWHWIPACIRDPFVNFLINQVLKRIPLFKQVTELLPAMWEKIKATALPILRKVFKEGKLKEAALDVLHLVLDALQVPLELVQTVIAKGRASIDLILDKPLDFLTNMLAALKQGAIQFGDSIVTHLLSGLKNWLFEAAKKAGLHPPTELTFRAVFDFILEVLDLTVDKVLERLELKIGPEKMAKIRKALTAVSKIWEWVATLLNEGPAGVWKKLTEKLGNLWQGVLDAAVDYITKTITKTAIPKLTGMIAGGPIGVVINGIIAIWKALQTFAKYFKRILEIMNGVFDTIGDIARGAIAGAANMIEDLMDRVLPIMIAFLANQISLGDISERIEKMLVTIRAQVVVAIDWVIDKALAIGGAILGLVKAGIAKVTEWWKAFKKFRQDGKEHTLKFKNDDPDAPLVVQSTPLVLSDYLKTLKPPVTKAQKEALAGIEVEQADIARLKKMVKDEGKKWDEKTIGPAITASLSKIAEYLEALTGEKPPRTHLEKQAVHTVGGEPLGEDLIAKPLTIDPGPLTGSAPHERTKVWDAVSARRDTYVRGHLLNHQVHGPGMNFNMAPIPIAANNEMAREVERDVKKAVLVDRKFVEYRVTMEYVKSNKRVNILQENELPKGIKLEAYEIKKNEADQWERVGKPLIDPYSITIDLPEPDVPAGQQRPWVILNTDEPEVIAEIHGITAAQVKAIVDNRPYSEYSDLDKLGLPHDLLERLKKDNRVKLYGQAW